MDQQRDFKGIWIPKELYLNKELAWSEKILLIEIDSLDAEEHCFASNEYFAKFLGVSERRIQQSINKLKQLGLVEQVYYDGRKRGLKSNISTKLSTKLSTEEKNTKKIAPQGRKKLRPSEDVCFTHNNIINNIYNNNLNKNKSTMVVSDQFCINDFGEDIQVYRKELGNEIVDDVERWIKSTKQGKRIDKQFVCRQFLNFAKRQGIEP